MTRIHRPTLPSHETKHLMNVACCMCRCTRKHTCHPGNEDFPQHYSPYSSEQGAWCPSSLLVGSVCLINGFLLSKYRECQVWHVQATSNYTEPHTFIDNLAGTFPSSNPRDKTRTVQCRRLIKQWRRDVIKLWCMSHILFLADHMQHVQLPISIYNKRKIFKLTSCSWGQSMSRLNIGNRVLEASSQLSRYRSHANLCRLRATTLVVVLRVANDKQTETKRFWLQLQTSSVSFQHIMVLQAKEKELTGTSHWAAGWRLAFSSTSRQVMTRHTDNALRDER